MEEFSNDVLDISQITKFEAVAFTKLEPNYWKVKLIYFAVTFCVLATGIFLAMFYIEDFPPYKYEIAIAFVVIFFIILGLQRIGFNKKAFAFRNHDVLYKYGIIATNTIIIPYNRVQHVASHEDIISRYFGLVQLEIFTAGESSSDIKIPGIKREQAESIKQLLIAKIQTQLQ